MSPPEPDRPSGLLAWATAEQAPLVVDVARAIGRPILSVGGPGNADAAALQTAVTAAHPEAEPPATFGDLRHAVTTLEGASAETGVDRILVAARGPLEADERAALRAAGVPVISLEPRPGRLADFLGESAHDEIVRVPRLAAGPAWRLAGDAIAEFGPIQMLQIAMAGRPEEGSLHARLHDAMDVLDRLVTLPTGVAAGMDRGPGDVPEHLSALRGSMAAELRGDEGWCAAIACSDAAPSWSRQVVATGPAGRFQLDDAGFTWTSPDGRVAERLRVGDAPEADEVMTAADGPAIIAEVLARPLREGPEPSSRDRRLRRFALCETARLAARTGERESPSRLANVLGAGSDG